MSTSLAHERHVRDQVTSLYCHFCGTWPPSAAPSPALTREALMDAEHRWCVQVEGDYALRHKVTDHAKQADYILKVLAGDKAEAPR